MRSEDRAVPARSRRALATTALAWAIAVVALLVPASASAAVEWGAEIKHGPTYLVPGERGGIWVDFRNAGDTASSGFPTVTLDLPTGLTYDDTNPANTDAGNGWACSGTSSVTCSNFFGAFFPVPASAYSPGLLVVALDVDPAAPVGPATIDVTLDGSGGPPSTIGHAVRIAPLPTPFGVVDGNFSAGAFDPSGADYTQGGGHPHTAVADIVFNTKFTDPVGNPDASAYLESVETVEPLKDVVVDLPPGFVGNPENVGVCPDIEAIRRAMCPPASQVGTTTYIQLPLRALQMSAVYNIEPDADAPAQFAFNSPVGPVVLTPTLKNDGEWALRVRAPNLPEANPLFAARTTLWGIPGDPAHDPARCARPNVTTGTCTGVDSFGARTAEVGTSLEGSYDPQPNPGVRRPFLSNPTECTGEPVETVLHVSSWTQGAPLGPDGEPDLTSSAWKTVSDTAPAVTGCESLSFAPTISASTTTDAPDAPTGLTFEIGIPQNDDPDGLATAHLKDTTVLLPEGMRVNPSSASGLDACSAAQIGLLSKAPLRFDLLEPKCPQASKIGTVTVDTPLLEKPLSGDVFLARQGDNPFDSLLAIYLVVRGPGLLVKIAGHVEADAQTGQLSTTVLDNPQVPFDRLEVRLKGGPRAPLTNPERCGTQTVRADLTSRAGHSVSLQDAFTVACPGTATQFAPSFSAGTANPSARRHSPLGVRIVRSGGKELGRIEMTLPRGLLAGVEGVDVCAEAELAVSASRAGRATQAAGGCPSGSQIGTTTVGAGSGPSPYFARIPGTDVSGRVFLTGRYSGAGSPHRGLAPTAYGIAIEVPAVAGPFDLGTVLVRGAIFADTRTAQLTTVTDRLPRILQGIPLDLRDIRVAIDRPGFVLNPSSCARQDIRASIAAQDGSRVGREARFAVGDCASLRFRPRMALRLTGRRQVTTGRHPGVRAVVRQPGTQAGIRRVEVRLPRSLALDPDNAQALCEFGDGTQPDLENKCPEGSIVGRARAISPLLKRPLRGNVYFVKNVRIDPDTGNEIRTLPMIIAALRGEVAVNLRGLSTVKGGKLVSIFAGVPDAPISQFNLNIKGGADGILAVTRNRRSNINLCRAGRQIAEVDADAHSGRRSDFDVAVRKPCVRTQRGKSRAGL